MLELGHGTRIGLASESLLDAGVEVCGQSGACVWQQGRHMRGDDHRPHHQISRAQKIMDLMR
jgi:hypothetical protein